MQLRKVQEMGGATLLVSLPKEWARASMLEKGSVVSIETSGDGGLLIYPMRGDSHPEKEIEIEYPSHFAAEGLGNEIIAAYLLGYDLIRVRGKHRISLPDRERIVSSVKKLIGLEVVEEDAQSITSQFLVDNAAVEPKKIFKRSSTLVRAMVSDVLGQFASGEPLHFEAISQRDDEVDRLHFLLVRLIRTAVRDARAAVSFGLTTIDCLDYRVAAGSIETAGDYAVELATSMFKLPREELEGSKRYIQASSSVLDALLDGATRAFLAKDFTIAREVLSNYDKLESILTELREESKAPLLLLHSADIIERIARCQRDIADLVSPMRQ